MRIGHHILFQLLSFLPLLSQEDYLQSKIYAWDSLPVEYAETRQSRQALEGKTASLDYLEIHITTLYPNLMPHKSHTHSDMEELIIVGDGNMKAMVGDESEILGKGGFILALPGMHHGIFNPDTTNNTTYYIIRWDIRDLTMPYDTTIPAMFEPGNIQLFIPNNKGYQVEDLFRYPTAKLSKLRIQKALLAKGRQFPPLNHNGDMVVIVLSGELEVSIGEMFQSVKEGSVIYSPEDRIVKIQNMGEEESEFLLIGLYK